MEETGQPKVLDFGVARATDADLLTAAGLTQTGQLLGTPNYMSPEQVTADPAAIDHRADVYALGVILFELVAHRLPYQLENRPLAEAARLILEQDPPRLGSIDPELRGDVETIVAKALEKDPARRYPSAADLAADLRRWLAHEPILARPPSALYHLRKFARRHKGLVGGVVATGVALVLGLVGTILFAVGEARQRGQAEQNAGGAEKREALFQAYRARLAAAVAALSDHDVADAARQLDAAPEDLRGWEWRHLHSRLDDSSAVIPLPAGGVGFLLAAPDRLRVGVLTGAGLRLTDLEGGELRTLPIGPERGRARHRHADPPRASGRGVGREHGLRPARRGRAGPLSRGHAGGRRRPSRRREPGRHAAGVSLVRRRVERGSRCSTRPPASRRPSATATAAASGASPSARTARGSPRPARIGRRACGTRPPARCWPRAGGTRARSSASRSARTARAW